MGFDRPIDGVETAVAAAHAAVSSATQCAFQRGLARVLTPPALTPSDSYRQARPQPIAALFMMRARARFLGDAGWALPARPGRCRPGAIQPATRLALANAIYFNAVWQLPFDERSTAPGPFHTPGGGLADTLEAMGMPNAFDERAADFSGLNGTSCLAGAGEDDERFLITDVVHKAFVSVDEAGTEAAAATAVIVGTTAVDPGEPVRLTVDRPFIFLVQDRETGAVLLDGRVSEPEQSR